MSTKDIIEYDTAILQQMTTDELLLQVICLEHLKTPKRQARLQLVQYAADTKAAVETLIRGLQDLGLQQLGSEVIRLYEVTFSEAVMA